MSMNIIEGGLFLDLTTPSSGGGGGGGTDNYPDLRNLPKMNNITIKGSHDSSYYGLQDALVSGTNIKTINNISLLGNGNIDIGGGSATNYDNITINLNSSDEIQTVGQIELNSNTATFDWVGTLSEYLAGRAANPQTITDDMICYITDDYDIPTDVVSDVLVGGTSVVTDGIAEINVPVDDVQINGTSILSSGVANIPVADGTTLGAIKAYTGYNIECGTSGDATGRLLCRVRTESQYTSDSTNGFISKGTLENIKNTYVRAVQPAYTAITASTASTTLAINSTYGQTPSVPVAYVIPAPTAGVDNWIKMFIDTSSVASISFTTTGGVSISPNQISDIEIGHKYMVVINYDNLHASWALFIKDMGTV